MIADRFPELPLTLSVQKELEILGMNPKRYACMAMVTSAGAGFLLSLLSDLLMFPLFFGALFGLLLMYPRIEIRRRTGEIEAQLPFFLRAFGIMSELGIPFRKAFLSASEGSGLMERECRLIIGETEKGRGFQRSISMLGQRYGSLDVKRAISQLALAYESGSRGPEIRRIGDDMLALQRHKMKEFSSKSALMGLLFMMSSVVMPTFFMVYASAGSFFGASVSASELSLALLVFFPLTSIFVLLLSRSMLPRSASTGNSGFDIIVLAPASIAVIGSLALPQWQLLFILMGAVAGAYLIMKTFAKERRGEDIEGRLADAVFSVSGLPKSAKPEDVFRAIKKGGFGPLSDEAGIALRQMEMNVRTKMVLDDLWKRNSSPAMRRMCVMLRQMIDTGSLDRMGLLADDMMAAAEMARQKARLFSIQKYTLIMGAILIPLIMKMILGLLAGLGDMSEAPDIPESIITSYILIYSGIVSIAISEFDGKKSSAAIYLILLTAISLSVFYFISL